ncbi:peptidoglycan editing factor PgeF [Bacillus sp. AM 13(2015)]|uniref:peptidoglycan editing factor PgeF n=1 Tax=Bacillus sp. AM 13(2015) TaxID=1739115 RepID=UPI000750E69C|nr:laccase [Bacillus sp. AM 13(2015)]
MNERWEAALTHKYDPFQQKSPYAMTIHDWTNMTCSGKEVLSGFTTKNGGFSLFPYQSLNTGLHVGDDASSVQMNRQVIADAAAVPLSDWVFADQTHEDRILKVTKEQRGRGSLHYDEALPGTDGLYTSETNMMLALCFADCVPLYFLAPQNGLIGTAHAGWKGTVKQIGAKMVDVWVSQEGAKVDQIQVVIGPSIGSCCYIVDDVVMDQVKQLPFSTEDVYSEISQGQYKIDLKTLNKNVLLHAGIKEENIHVSSMCTSCNDQLFFSHRRDQGKTGRMMSFVGFKEA